MFPQVFEGSLRAPRFVGVNMKPNKAITVTQSGKKKFEMEGTEWHTSIDGSYLKETQEEVAVALCTLILRHFDMVPSAISIKLEKP